ncbi:cytoplasmic protein [Priestia aryabhattai]
MEVKTTRPELTKDLPINDFTNFYWLKTELQQFCRKNNMSPFGSKMELSKRIEVFLTTGDTQQSKSPSKKRSPSKTKAPLTLDTVIGENHRCSQKVRTFFKDAIHPTFHFSTYIQNYFKENVGKTYRDVVKAWHEEEKRKKQPSYQKEIAPQFEYNRFIRDFFKDPKNNGKSRDDAIAAWKHLKVQPGSNQYRS